MPEFPKPDALEKIVPSNIRLTRRMWQRLDAVAKAEGLSRAEVIAHFLKWACDDWDVIQATKKRGK